MGPSRIPAPPAPLRPVVSPAERRFRLRVIGIGLRVTLVLCVAAMAYVALTPQGPHRRALLAIVAITAIHAGIVSLLPHERIIVSMRRDPLLLAAGNALIIVSTAISCLLDRQPLSPFSAIYFVSVAFAAVSLPRRMVRLVAAGDVIALLAPAAVLNQWPPALALVAPALIATAAVCADIAGDRARRSVALDETTAEMLQRIARVVEFRDRDTGAHVGRMSEDSADIAAELGWPPEHVGRLRLASAMHDIGKVGIPDAILLKPGPLTAEERDVMERHTVLGHEMLAGSESEAVQLAAEIALTHHERYDGGGYPRRLAGEDIPLAGRIVAVADVFDALTSDRVYRPAMPVDQALEIVEAGRGTQFDPYVLDAFRARLSRIVARRGARLSLPGTP
jgi:hypothetical protein